MHQNGGQFSLLLVQSTFWELLYTVFLRLAKNKNGPTYQQEGNQYLMIIPE
jgi:hypothetical protein